MKAKRRKKEIEAATQFAHHLGEAIQAFTAPEEPLWKRTANGLMAFKGLNLTDLPRRLDRDVDARFGAINRIIEPYDLKTWDDYQHLSDDDLLEIQSLVKGFALAD